MSNCCDWIRISWLVPFRYLDMDINSCAVLHTAPHHRRHNLHLLQETSCATPRKTHYRQWWPNDIASVIEEGSFRVTQYLSSTSRCTSNTDEVVALWRDGAKIASFNCCQWTPTVVGLVKKLRWFSWNFCVDIAFDWI